MRKSRPTGVPGAARVRVMLRRYWRHLPGFCHS
jgi:hypothetical protein